MSDEKRIVIAEDEDALMQAMNITLLDEGFDVLSAVNGEAALRLIESEKPDMVLLDLLMPKMTGFQVLEAMSQDPELSPIPVIVLSNLGQDEDIAKAKEFGAVDFYVKSDTDLDDLVEKINEVLGI